MTAKRIQSQVPARPSSSSGTDGASGSGNNNPDEHIDKKFKHMPSDGEDEDEDDEEEEDAPKSKRAGRRKINIEYIEEKGRRHITFSKRKSGIMKKAYELSTLTGTQVLLLVVSETGLVYTFTTPKLQPLVTQPEGKNLIQSCLHAPDDDAAPDDNEHRNDDSRSPTPVTDEDDRSSKSRHSGPTRGSFPHTSSRQQRRPSPYQQDLHYGRSSTMRAPDYPTQYNHHIYRNMGFPQYPNESRAHPSPAYGVNY